MNLVFEYIKYRWNHLSKQSKPSDFQTEFSGKCLRGKMASTDLRRIKSVVSTLKKDRRIIEIQDFGAGSKKLGNKRSVSAILKTSSSYGKYGEVLYQIATHFKSNRILEFGTSLGVGTHYFSLGNPDSMITTVEACANTRSVALENLPENVVSIESTFDAFIAQLSEEKFDIIYIDGHHNGTALLRYFNQLTAFTTSKTIFILDDIRWSDSMFSAWEKIINSENILENIDLFRMGIVVYGGES